MPKTSAEKAYEIAETRHGYFTVTEAIAAGISQKTVAKMADRGIAERISRGVYRLTRYPHFKHSQFMEAVLWPEGGEQGILSHESALDYHQLSDVSPEKVHITLPPKRMRRAVPAYLVIHRAVLPAGDFETVDAIPVTTPERSIRDCYTAGLGRRLIRQAIDDGFESGKLTTRQTAILRSELLIDATTAAQGTAPK